MAAGGHTILVTPMIITTDGVLSGLDAYRHTLADHGHDQSKVKITVNMPAYVARDSKKAKEGFKDTVNNYLDALRQGDGKSRGSERAMTLNYDLIYNELAVIGDPQECVDKLRRYQETFENQEFMFWFNIGGMLPHDEVQESMRLFAEEVMPHFK